MAQRQRPDVEKDQKGQELLEKVTDIIGRHVEDVQSGRKPSPKPGAKAEELGDAPKRR